eukprot:1155180-Pelagomonas_calceolata.AAC.6
MMCTVQKQSYYKHGDMGKLHGLKSHESQCPVCAGSEGHAIAYIGQHLHLELNALHVSNHLHPSHVPWAAWPAAPFFHLELNALHVSTHPHPQSRTYLGQHGQQHLQLEKQALARGRLRGVHQQLVRADGPQVVLLELDAGVVEDGPPKQHTFDTLDFDTRAHA